MKIKDVRIKEVTAVVADSFNGYQYAKQGERMVHPADIHYAFTNQSNVIHCMPDRDETRKLTQSFVEVVTDEGITGIYGAIGNAAVLRYVKELYGPVVIGLDPMAHERIWDIMFRTSPRAYAGEALFALSAIDNAIWDIKCKALGVPLYTLLGGPTREKILAYANCAGFSYEKEDVIEAVKFLKASGFQAMKWYAPYGPGSGEEGFRKNVKLCETLREAGGDQMRIMLDVWSGWDLPYAAKMLDVLKSLDFYFLEEPLMPAMTDSYITLMKNEKMPIALGENIFLRWGFKRLLDGEKNAIFQPDPEWCGGITETQKIINLISAYDSRFCMHASSTQLSLQMSLAAAPNLVDMVEYILTVAPSIQYFFKTPIVPKDGYFTLPEHVIGTGHDIDENKADSILVY